MGVLLSPCTLHLHIFCFQVKLRCDKWWLLPFPIRVLLVFASGFYVQWISTCIAYLYLYFYIQCISTCIAENLVMLRVLFTVFVLLKLNMGLKKKACVLVTVGAALGIRDHVIKSNSFALKPKLTTFVSSILQAELDQVDRSKKILKKGNEKHQAAEESLRMVVYLSCWGLNWTVCSILLSLVDQCFSRGAWNFHESRPKKIKDARACAEFGNEFQ